MKVALYIRSSKDQHKVSCEAQERQLREYASRNGDDIVEIFSDVGLSSINDVRPKFNQMIEESQSATRRFEKICCLDLSRFGRDSYSTLGALHKLREECGVIVDFMHMPITQTKSSNVLMENSFLGFSNYHSLVSKEKGVEGMKQNVYGGYRAGGIAPFGYKLEHHAQGKNKKGETVIKSKLICCDETAPILKEYMERRAKNQSRKSIFLDFFSRGIKTPRGKSEWSETTGKSWEDNVDQYLGHTLFNRTNEKVRENGKIVGFKGRKKYKDESEWVMKENTHAALISEEVGNAIKALRTTNKRANRHNEKRTYLLSGLLKCSECGASYIGDRSIYRCNAQTKAGSECHNNGISKGVIEDAVFSYIHKEILSSGQVVEIIKKCRKKLIAVNPEIELVDKRLEQLGKEISKLVDLFQSDIIDKETLKEKLTPLNDQKQIVGKTLETLRGSQEVMDVSNKEIYEVIKHLTDEIVNADPNVVKPALHSMIEEIVVWPKDKDEERRLEVRGSFLPLTRVNMVTPTGNHMRSSFAVPAPHVGTQP